jgi:hypothetical protein
MNILRNILTWRTLHFFLCWTERGVAVLCVLMALCSVSLPGGNFGLGMGVVMLGVALGIVLLSHVVIVSNIKKINLARKPRIPFRLYLISIGLCVGLVVFHTPLMKARLTLSRGSLESAAEHIDQHQAKGRIGLYRIRGVEKNGNVVEFHLADAGIFIESYYLLYAPDGLVEYRSQDYPFRSDPDPLGDNWWVVCYSD